REAQERFQRSADTISKAFHRILQIACSAPFYTKYVHLPEDTTPEIIAQDRRYQPFRDCLAAIDGS
ncbi:hypothetical protein F5890DRAFT_1384639, partial [Lentinula detonsa]